MHDGLGASRGADPTRTDVQRSDVQQSEAGSDVTSVAPQIPSPVKWYQVSLSAVGRTPPSSFLRPIRPRLPSSTSVSRGTYPDRPRMRLNTTSITRMAASAVSQAAQADPFGIVRLGSSGGNSGRD